MLCRVQSYLGTAFASRKDSASHRGMRGTAPFKELFRTFREALGDLDIAVEKTVTEGDTCAAYCRVRGRHVGNKTWPTEQSAG